jgi:polyphenol oxidase
MRTASNLAGIPNIAHGFFGREGGVSTGIYQALNCGPGSNDDRSAVIENRRIALTQLANGAAAQLVTLYQIHSAECVIVNAPWNIGEAPRADAMATNITGLALGILTADCAPVLLADAQARVIGAAHAGWKGAHGGIIESVLTAMERLGADRARIRAAIGPCISQRNYEVGPEFRAQFLASKPEDARFFVASDRPDHFRFDLEAYVATRLAAAGVDNVDRQSVCTYENPDAFYSFRRATHRGEADYGRELSAIMLTP